MTKPTPRSYPITHLPATAAFIKLWLAEVLEMERKVSAPTARSLDDETIRRTLHAYLKMQDDVSTFQGQLRSWHNRPLSLAQRGQLEEARLEFERIKTAITSVLADAARLRGPTRSLGSPGAPLKREDRHP